jgi:ABC-2 type transport system permease protein
MRWTWTVVSLFLLQTQVKLARMMQYRVDFAVGVLVSLGFSAMMPLFQLLIYSRTRGFPGWSYHQILLFQGVLLVTSGLRELLLGDVRPQIEQLTERGELDRLLTKPFPPLLLILTGGFSPYSFGLIVVGAGTLGYAWAQPGVGVTVGGFALFLVLLCASLMLALSASILYCTLAVRWTYLMRLDETMDKVLGFGNYPLQVYPTFFRVVFLTLLPFSVATFLPAQALLGRVGPSALTATAATLAVFVLMLWFWHRQLEQYTSAGG